VNRAVVESFTADALPKTRADPSSLRSMAPGWLAKLSGKGGGALRIRSNLAGAAVSLDGTRVGTTGGEPVVITDVAPGRHEVAVEKSGYTTTKQEFTLAAGQSLPLNLTLSPVSVEVMKQPGRGESNGQGFGDETPDGDTHTLTRTGFWIAAVGTVASAGLALKFGLDVKDINNQLDAYRRFPCNSATGFCDGNGQPAKMTLTQDEAARSASLTSTGNRDQLLQWVFVGFTGAFAIASGVLLYKGYLSTEGSNNSASNHGLRLFPTASATAGGIIAEFDF
jgi:hypothetical protein